MINDAHTNALQGMMGNQTDAENPFVAPTPSPAIPKLETIKCK